MEQEQERDKELVYASIEDRREYEHRQDVIQRRRQRDRDRYRLSKSIPSQKSSRVSK